MQAKFMNIANHNHDAKSKSEPSSILQSLNLVDRWGDKIIAAPLHGDTWRARHDKVKSCIKSLCIWRKLTVTSQDIQPLQTSNPSGGGGGVRLFQAGMAMPDPITDISRRLAELKVITFCSS